jgi:DNA-binding transcriptional MerR regulator
VSDATPEAAAEMTIDELARRAGMTVRNIRAHQSRGLLPPPEVRGRTGYYGPEHVARVELIKEMQADGFNLEAIKRLLESSGGSTDEVLRFTRAVTAPFEDETPEVLEMTELAENFGDGDPKALERAIDLGLVRPLGEGRFEQRSPRLAAAGRELRELGIAPARSLEVAADMRRHADGVAKAFVQLFLDEVWKPFDEAGQPPERWPEVFDALERLRPLAAESLLALFQIVMTERVERALGKEIEKMAGGVAREEPRSRGSRGGGRSPRSARSRGR